MIDLSGKIGPLSIRAWGLIVNFAANVVTMFGLAQMLNQRGGVLWVVTGFVGTAICVGILAYPTGSTLD